MKTIVHLLAAFLFSAVSASAQTDLAAKALTPLDYQVPGTKSFSLTVQNVGSSGAISMNIYWQLDNGPVSNINKLISAVAWDAGIGLVKDPAFNVTLPAAGNNKLKVWIQTIPADVNPSNDTVTQNINVFATLPKKNVVLEVYKHQDCGPCYKAAVYNDTFVSKNTSYAIAGTQ